MPKARGRGNGAGHGFPGAKNRTPKGFAGMLAVQTADIASGEWMMVGHGGAWIRLPTHSNTTEVGKIEQKIPRGDAEPRR